MLPKTDAKPPKSKGIPGHQRLVQSQVFNDLPTASRLLAQTFNIYRGGSSHRSRRLSERRAVQLWSWTRESRHRAKDLVLWCARNCGLRLKRPKEQRHVFTHQRYEAGTVWEDDFDAAGYAKLLVGS